MRESYISLIAHRNGQNQSFPEHNSNIDVFFSSCRRASKNGDRSMLKNNIPTDMLQRCKVLRLMSIAGFGVNLSQC